jgi:hypothetical protein
VISGRRAATTLVLVSALRTAGADPCAPRAALDGDASAVERVAAELARLGVATDHGASPPDPHCPIIAAAVELDRGGGITVAVRDGAQRSEARVVSDAALAAAWIDSWVHDGFDPSPVTESVEQPVIAPPGITARSAPAPFYDRLALSASYDQMWTDDGSNWSGFSAAACVHVGALCVGVRARYASGLLTTPTTAASRSDTALLATAGLSYALGRMQVSPEVGLGAGRMTIDRDECPAVPPVPPMCNPNDPTCNPNMPAPATTCTNPSPTSVYIGDGFSGASVTPRASVALRVEVPLFDHVWLDGIASAMVAPFGHDGVWASHPVLDPMTMSLTDPGALPGDPTLSLQVGVGLRIGGR